MEVLETRQLLNSLNTTTTLAASAATLLHGQSLTLTATVSDGDPVNGGTVTFTAGASTLGTGTVTNGTATLTIPGLPVGVHPLGASYGGKPGDNPSTANSGYIQTVLAASHPADVAVDSSGNLYIVEETNNEVVKVTPGGTTTVVAGNRTSGYSGNGGPATAARLNSPRSVALDSSGNLYIADGGNYAIRKVTPEGVITTVAGTHNQAGSTGDGGPATSAKLLYPYGVAVDSSGDIFISDSSYRVREVTPDGTIHTYAGNGTAGYTGDNGPATSASVSAFNVTTDSSGDLFIEDFSNNVIREVVTALLLPVTGNPTSTTLTASSPSIPVGQTLTLTVTVADAASDSISGGTVTFKDGATTLGTATLANGTASLPVSNLAVGPHRLTASYGGQTDCLASASGLSPASTIGTFAGTGTAGSGGDGGAATSAELSSPFGLAYDSQGDLFIADFANKVVREVTTDGVIHTVAGTGASGYSGDGGPATAATFNYPGDVVVDAAGDLFIADTYNNVIREVTPDGVIRTIAGIGTPGYGGDGGPATSATLNYPFGLTLDPAGDVVIADSSNDAIRAIDAGLTVDVTPAPATRLLVTGGSGVAGSVETITVTALDADGNLVTGYAGTVHLTSTDGRAVLPADAALVGGVGTFRVTLATAGVQSITATDAATPALAGTSAGLAVTPAAAARLSVTGGVGEAASGVEALTVTAYDAYGNVARGYAGTVNITSSDASAALPASATFANGVANFAVTFGTGGTRSLTVTDAADAGLAGTASFNVNAMVAGRVYHDLNADGSPEAGEPGLAGRVVFLDLNGDGKLDPGEPTATTDAHGAFALIKPMPGPAAVVEATGLDANRRHVVDQVKVGADGTVSIGVVPISPVAPVKVVPNPFSASPAADANSAYVQSLYHAVLGRVGSDSEVAGWVAKMQAGMGRSKITAGFVNSLEHRQDEVAAYYQEFFHRAPDPASAVWVRALNSGASEETVVGAILNSPEYQSAHRDSTAFVRDLYIDVLGRQGEAAGLAGWQSALASGASRQAVVAAFIRSTEAIDQLVESDYTAFLRHPREQGASSAGWSRMLEGPNGSATTVAVGILSSPEFVKDSTTPRS